MFKIDDNKLSETTDEENDLSNEEEEPVKRSNDIGQGSLAKSGVKSEVKLVLTSARRPSMSNKLTDSISGGVKLPMLTNKSGS